MSRSGRSAVLSIQSFTGCRCAMKRFYSLRLMLLVCLVLGGCILFAVMRSNPDAPNVLLITLDTTRADHIGCYGADFARTPVLDKLAAEGVLFERSYTPVPLTLPSHATMLTGLYPPEHGLRINAQKALDPSIPTLAEKFHQRGYNTSAFIASYVLNSTFGLSRGFMHYDDDVADGEKGEPGVHQLRSARQIVDAALSWLTFTEKDRNPFFAWVHIVDPHMPCQEHADEFGSDFAGRAYDAEVAYADKHIGRLITWLEAQDKLRNTIIVVVGDHGEGLGEHGESEHGYMVYETTMHVPLIFRIPERLPNSRSQRVPRVVSIVDLYPTILTLAGLPTEDAPGISGQDLFADIGDKKTDSLAVYGESDAPLLEAGWSSLRSIATDRWKYIRTQRPELYDLASDPKEINNLVDKHPDILNDLEERLLDLESGMNPRFNQEAGLKLQSRAIRALESIGYVGSVSEPAPAVVRRDIKDVIRYPDLLEKSMALVSDGKLEEASVILEDIVAHVPDYARALGTLGICRATQKRSEEAIESFRESLKCDPNLYFVQVPLAQTLIGMGRSEEALDHLKDFIRQFPEDPEFQYLSGEACQQLGRHVEAEKFFASADQLSRNSGGQN